MAMDGMSEQKKEFRIHVADLVCGLGYITCAPVQFAARFIGDLGGAASAALVLAGQALGGVAAQTSGGVGKVCMAMGSPFQRLANRIRYKGLCSVESLCPIPDPGKKRSRNRARRKSP